MAKIVSYPDGSRMLVSDDMPDIDYEQDDLIPVTKQNKTLSNETDNSVSFVTMCLMFDDTIPALPFRANKLIVSESQVKLFGSMLLDDFMLLVENKDQTVSYIEIETQEKAFKIAKNHKLKKAVAKEMDTIYVLVDLLLTKHN